MLPWNLEDWLTEEGDRVVLMRTQSAELSPRDQLIYEIWLLDTESRNGGLSQYFANRGIEQWRNCVAAASSGVTPSFLPFAGEVAAMIGGSDDPYQSLVKLGRGAEEAWDRYSAAVVSELKGSR
jgi:hypothetical protein